MVKDNKDLQEKFDAISKQSSDDNEKQVQALRWLQGKAEDQLVKAFIQVHVEMLERIGYAIKDNGTQL